VIKEPRMLSESSIKLQPLPRVVFGAGASDQAGKFAQETGKVRALIVTDAGLVKAGLAGTLAGTLKADGLETEIFDGVEANPTDKNVAAGVARLNALGDAVVVALGGGSSMDCAKAIALLAKNEGHPRDFGYGCKPKSPGAPVIAIPTTAGTGSETNLVGVITDTEQNRKLYVAHPSVQPRVAVLDPKLTLGLPAFPTATCGFDVVTHAIEAYTSRAANPYADGVALQALKMAWANLPQAIANGGDLEARSQMLLASAMAAIAFNVVGLGAAHGTGHPISARFHTAHGQTLATMLPHVMRFNLEARAAKYAEIAMAIGAGRPGASDVENAKACIAAVEGLVQKIGLHKSLKDLGAASKDIGQLAEDALQDLTIRTNPRKVTADDARALFEAAMA
jgi:alcohol dehydrogenase